MAIYVSAVSLAAIIQIGIIYFLKADFWQNFLYAIPFILAYQFLFLWSYAKAPNFLVIWFITTVLTNGLAFLLGYFLWHEQVSILNIVGVILVIAGVIFLQIK